MSLKRLLLSAIFGSCFLGTVSGLAAGPLFILLYDGFVQPVKYVTLLGAIFTGAVFGGVAGILIGTAVALTIAWSPHHYLATQIGTSIGGVFGLITITSVMTHASQTGLLLPLLGLIWGGFVGWGSGRLLEWQR